MEKNPPPHSPPRVSADRPVAFEALRTESDFPSHHRTASSYGRRRATVSGPVAAHAHRRNTSFAPYRPGHLRGRSRMSNISRASSTVNLALIGELLAEREIDTETYGVAESRDGFFDGFFLRPPSIDNDELLRNVESTLPEPLGGAGLDYVKGVLMKQWYGLQEMWYDITSTRTGLLVFKSFLAFYIAYVLCLVPVVREWLGRYNYVMAVSTIVNHPGRTVGSQVDGAIMTIIGTAAGLGWGAVGLLLSTATDGWTGYGAILAVFIAAFMAFIGFVRSYFIRLYQLVLCAGMAICYTCLADVDGKNVKWEKIYAYAIPWLLGQAIALVVCVVVYPDAGARPLAEVLHDTFTVMQEGLIIPQRRTYRTHLRLVQSFSSLSTAYRDMKLDFTIARFRTKDIEELRNLIQGVIRSLISIKSEAPLFEDLIQGRPSTRGSYLSAVGERSPAASVLNFGAHTGGGSWPPFVADSHILQMAIDALRSPTQTLIDGMRDGLRTCDAVLMTMSGHRSAANLPSDVPCDIPASMARLQEAMREYDEAEALLSDSQELRGYNPEIIKLIGLARSIRMTADPMIRLMARLQQVRETSPHTVFNPPAYAFWKSLNRTNAQVRHDRGSVTPSSYRSTFKRIRELVEKIKAREHHPLHQGLGGDTADSCSDGEYDENAASSIEKPIEPSQRPHTMRHKLYRASRHIKGVEGKYALRVVVITGILATPGYVASARGWWNQYDAWWAVCMAWIMSHTMVGGNLGDLFIRAGFVVMSALWSGFAFSARDGNPFVMAAFALLFMFPMMYRFTRSNHARSGLAACLSFTVISLGLVTSGGTSPPAAIRGVAFLVGVVAAIIVNWILWPFIARHELKKSISLMLFFLSVIYRDMVATYVYYEHSEPPTQDDIQESEILESHLREGFARMRQLLFLTAHELRLRAPFDPKPYSALVDACEGFFGDLVTVRQAALFYAPQFLRSGDAARKVLGYRRDAVASVLTNLYVLSGALKAGVRVPRYLPSAAVSRKRLLDMMAEVEAELPDSVDPEVRAMEKWGLIYRFAYNESLTRCVAHLEDMEKYTKLILGERGFEDDFKDESDDDDSDIEMM